MQITPRLAFLSLATLAAAQDVSSLPSCAQTGAANAISATDCESTDIACICDSASFISSLQTYAEANCSAADYATAIAVGQAICASATASSTTTASTTTASSTTATSTVTSTTTSGTTTSTVTTTMTSSVATDSDDLVSDGVTYTTRVTTECSVVTLTELVSSSSTAMTSIATYTGAAAAAGGRDAQIESGLLAAGLMGLIGLII